MVPSSTVAQPGGRDSEDTSTPEEGHDLSQDDPAPSQDDPTLLDRHQLQPASPRQTGGVAQCPISTKDRLSSQLTSPLQNLGLVEDRALIPRLQPLTPDPINLGTPLNKLC